VPSSQNLNVTHSIPFCAKEKEEKTTTMEHK
jgi:hypothetical protein